MPLHPNQANVHPMATGDSYELWRVKSMEQQPRDYLKTPEWRRMWESQKWTQRTATAQRPASTPEA